MLEPPLACGEQAVSTGATRCVPNDCMYLNAENSRYRPQVDAQHDGYRHLPFSRQLTFNQCDPIHDERFTEGRPKMFSHRVEECARCSDDRLRCLPCVRRLKYPGRAHTPGTLRRVWGSARLSWPSCECKRESTQRKRECCRLRNRGHGKGLRSVQRTHSRTGHARIEEDRCRQAEDVCGLCRVIRSEGVNGVAIGVEIPTGSGVVV
jgi:hypothetical protein